MALTSILTTAAVTVGVIAVANRVRKRLGDLRRGSSPAAQTERTTDAPTLDLEKDPVTGTYRRSGD